MGLLSDPCPNPDCNGRVKKTQRFCPKCGYAGPNSLVSCPDCGKKAGGSTRFCWNCGADLEKGRPPRIVGDRWVRDEDEVAVRVDPDDCKGFLKRVVTVGPGTIGVLEKKGKLVKEVEWGTKTLDQFLQITAPTPIYLISEGDVVLRPTFAGLRDANGMELDVTIQVILRAKDYDTFVRRFFEGHTRRVTTAMLADRVALELHDVMRGLICAYPLEDMYGNLEWRDSLEQRMRDALTVTLDRNGLELVQLNFVGFAGDHFEQLQHDRGEVYMGNHAADVLAERQAIRERVSDLERQGELEKYKSTKELADEIEALDDQYGIKSAMRRAEREETVNQALHELELKNKLREYELADLEIERAQQVEDERLARQQELDKIKLEHQKEMRITIILARQAEKASQADFDREQVRLRDDAGLDVEWKRSEQGRRMQRADAVQGYELAIQESGTNLKLAQDRTAERLEELRGKQAELDLLHEDDHKKQDLKVEYERHQGELLRQIQQQERENLESMQRFKLEQQKLEVDAKRFEIERQTEVQLAKIDADVKITDSESVKQAAVQEAVTGQLRERLEDQQAAVEAAREDGDRRAGDLKEIAGMFAGKEPGPTVVVSGQGGVARPVTAKEGEESPCPDCARPVSHTAKFCPWCGRKMGG